MGLFLFFERIYIIKIRQSIFFLKFFFFLLNYAQLKIRNLHITLNTKQSSLTGRQQKVTIVSHLSKRQQISLLSCCLRCGAGACRPRSGARCQTKAKSYQEGGPAVALLQ